MNTTPANITKAEHITRTLTHINNILIHKNTQYGNSVSEPIRVFSSESDTLKRVGVRIDDKLSRLRTLLTPNVRYKRGSKAAKSRKLALYDTIIDLIGYLVLFLIELDENVAETVAKQEHIPTNMNTNNVEAGANDDQN